MDKRVSKTEQRIISNEARQYQEEIGQKYADCIDELANRLGLSVETVKRIFDEEF